MIELVTLEQAKEKLKIVEDNTKDDEIVGLIRGCSIAVLHYLQLDEDAYLNSDGTMDMDSATLGYNEVPENVQLAVLHWITVLMSDPAGHNATAIFDPLYPPSTVIGLLYPMRTPSLA